MPYVVRKNKSGGGTVYKKGPGSKPGKKVGSTKGSVKKYLAALHANIKESYCGKFEKLFESQLNNLNQVKETP